MSQFKKNGSPCAPSFWVNILFLYHCEESGDRVYINETTTHQSVNNTANGSLRAFLDERHVYMLLSLQFKSSVLFVVVFAELGRSSCNWVLVFILVVRVDAYPSGVLYKCLKFLLSTSLLTFSWSICALFVSDSTLVVLSLSLCFVKNVMPWCGGVIHSLWYHWTLKVDRRTNSKNAKTTVLTYRKFAIIFGSNLYAFSL